jgi:hypothetical protein
MPINIKNYLKEKLADADPSIDGKDGTGVGDLLLTPLEQILEKYDTQNSNLLAKFSKINIDDLSEDEMKTLALNFLLSRSDGNKASGEVVFYYTDPSTIIIAQGAVITSGQKRFEVLSNYSISKGSLIYESPYYKTAPISVLATEAGTEYNLPAGSFFELSGYASKRPTKITNTAPFTNGTNDESNSALYDRIKTSLFGQFLSSPVVIENYLKSVQSSINNVDIVGYGNPLMLRDLVYDVSLDGTYNKADYKYVHTGTAVAGKDKLHKAYYGTFASSGLTELSASLTTDNVTSVIITEPISFGTRASGYIIVIDDNGISRQLHYSSWSGNTFTIDSSDGNEDFASVNATAGNSVWVINEGGGGVGIGLPTSPSAWSTEFTDDMYKGLFHNDDIDYAVTVEEAILEAFTSGSTLPTTGKGSNALLTTNGWELKDGSSKDNEIKGYGDIVLVNGALRLGENYYTTIEVQDLQDEIKDLQGELASHNFGSTAAINDAKLKLKELLTQLETIIESNVEHNPSPVVTKQIDVHKGIKIETTFATTDASDEGSVSYINVLKNNLIMTPHDGYGAAWRKQPEYLIRLDKDEYTSESDPTLQDDIDKFEDEYKLNGHDFRGRLSGNRGTIHPDAKSKIWKYNVYIVDNNLLEDEVWVSSEQIWNQASGRDQFLSAGKAWIEQEIEYDLKIEINENMGVKVWIDPDTNQTPITAFGPTAPSYVPDANEDITVGAETAQRSHIGFGVTNTHNYEWYYKNLIITPTINVFPGHLFKIDASDFTSTNGVNYYYSGTATAEATVDQTSGNSALQLAIYNFTSESWEVLGTSTVALPGAVSPYVYTNNLISDTISSGNGAGITISALTNYLDNNFIYFAALPIDYTIDLHELRTYYFEVNDGEYTGVHKGNAVDIYAHDPTNVVTGSVEQIVSSQEIDFNDNAFVNGYIQEILNVSEAYSNISLDQSEWAVVNAIRERGEAFSKHNRFKIKFNSSSYNGSKMRITYRYWNKGAVVDNYIQDSDVRQPAVDYMLKISPPVTVIIENLNYAGDVTENTMKLKIAEFINSIDSKTLEKSDLVNHMYDEGATYVDLDMTITLRLVDSDMQTTNINFTSQSYTISSSVVSRYYTHIDELYGVTRL